MINPRMMDTADRNSLVAILKGQRHTGKCPAGTYRTDGAGDLAVGLFPDFGAGGVDGT